MPIQMTCSACQTLMNAPDALAGKRAKCPSCGHILNVPGQPAGPPMAASSPEPPSPAPDNRDRDIDDDADRRPRLEGDAPGSRSGRGRDDDRPRNADYDDGRSRSRGAGDRRDDEDRRGSRRGRGRDRNGRAKSDSNALLWILLGGGALLLLLCCGGSTLFVYFVSYSAKTALESIAKEHDDEVTRVAEGKDAMKVSAVDLWKAYKDNELLADAKYTDQLVEVTGIVASVDWPYVNLNEVVAGNNAGLIEVLVSNASLKTMRTWKPGSTITLRGGCKGKKVDKLKIDNALFLN